MSGIGDGLSGLAKAVFGIVAESVKLSPLRMLVDPTGYLRDEEHFAHSAQAFVSDLIHDPSGFAKSLIDYNELKTDPVHWAGELLPTIVLAAVSDGAGLGSKVADGAGALDASSSAARLSVQDLLDQGVDVSRWEGVAPSDGASAGHTIRFHINSSDLSNEDYIKNLISSDNGRPLEGIFTSQGMANDAIGQVLELNRPDIEAWLSNPQDVGLRRYDVEFIDQPIGLAMKVSDPNIQYTTIGRFILRKSDVAPEGFIVQTAFPTYTPYYVKVVK